MIYSLPSVAGKIAGFVGLLGFIPYLISMVRRENKPNRASWIIWAVLGIILLVSYKKAGATDAIWVSVANVINLSIIVIFSFKYGEGGWNLFDMVCLSLALLGLLLWWTYNSPLPALYICTLVDLLGALPTLKKSYLNPYGENRLAWILFFIANTINLFAISQWSLAMVLYPLYLFLICGTLVIILTLRRNHKSPLTS